jgi:hypothetical protein
MIFGFSVSALLSAAWWTQKLSGVNAKAIATTVAAVAAIVIAGLCLLWLRHDAYQDGKRDEARAWEAKMSAARLAAAADLRRREQASARIAALRAAERESRLAATAQRNAELEAELAKRPPSTAYSVEVARQLARRRAK